MSDEAAIAAYEHAIKPEHRNAWMEAWKPYEALADAFKATFSKYLGSQLIDFSLGPGWWGVMREIRDELDKMSAMYPEFEFKILQVKEKFGGLRVYCRTIGDDGPLKDIATQALFNIIQEKTGKADKLCDVCGEPGKRRPSGWIVTRCDKHAPIIDPDDY
jgi:hypothetical protein